MTEQRSLVIVAVDRAKGRRDILRRQQIAQARHRGKVLTHQLIDQATFTYLKLRILRVVGAHCTAQRGRNLAFGPSAYFLHEILAIEEIRVDPLTAVLEQTVVLIRRRGVTRRAS